MAGREPLSYFTTTLGEALAYNQKHHGVKLRKTEQAVLSINPKYGSIAQFVDFLAREYGEKLAVGCVTPVKRKDAEGDYTSELLTFSDLQKHTRHVSQHFRSRLGTPSEDRKCVALLSSSSIVFMLVWLGLIRAGFEVLLVAPQNSPDAVRHLVKSSRSIAVCFDGEHEDFARKAIGNERNDAQFAADAGEGKRRAHEVEAIRIELQSVEDVRTLETHATDDEESRPDVNSDSVAFYFHSSGTTALPKLISQTHHGAVGILPMFQDISATRLSTFTTTPLYHGGIADSLRSWSAASPVWLFPEGKAPIIGQTVAACIRGIDEISQQNEGLRTRLAYLSCVPYILEAIVDTPSLRDRIRRLDAVGVGGAAMPKDFGDRLVADGFNLVSRFGSAECGFLLSSQRDFDTDKEWDVLRSTRLEGLRFQPLSEEKLELVVTRDWPLVSNAPHAERPFNTHDVFTPHATIPNAWHYTGRSDSQLTLKTGKKFDPTDIEKVLKQSNHIVEAVVIGNDRPFAGAVIFVSKGEFTTPNGQELLRDNIFEVNKRNPKHAHLSTRSIYILNSEDLGRLRKNNKGGVIRSAFEKDFEKEIKTIYGSADATADGSASPFNVDELPSRIMSIVKDTIGSAGDLKLDDDLFEHGVDSAGSIQIRRQVLQLIPASKQVIVPVNIVYECGTISSLVKFVADTLGEQQGSSSAPDESEKKQEMSDMATSYMERQSRLLEKTLEAIKQSIDHSEPTGKAIILTGSTGFLGVHLLHLLLHKSSFTKIYLFVRGSRLVSWEDQEERAKARVLSALNHHGFDDDATSADFNGRVVFIPAILKESLMAIPAATYVDIMRETTHVIHAAWEVNFNLPLKTFGPQIEGTVNLLNLLISGSRHASAESPSTTVTRANEDTSHKPKLIFCSSIASVARSASPSQPAISNASTDAAPLGYAQSKWVAERVLSTLSPKYPAIDISILRVGQLSGARRSGIWNKREAWPLMLSAGIGLGGKDGEGKGSGEKIVLPDLAGTKESAIDWLPVDLAAQDVLAHTSNAAESPDTVSENLHVDHTAYTGPLIPWSTANTWIAAWAESKGLQAEFLPAAEWLDRLEAWDQEHQAKSLVGLWRGNWTKAKDEARVEDGDAVEGIEGGGGDDWKLGKGYLWRVLDWVREGEET